LPTPQNDTAAVHIAHGCRVPHSVSFARSRAVATLARCCVGPFGCAERR
jgi:hypothetical protein